MAVSKARLTALTINSKLPKPIEGLCEFPEAGYPLMFYTNIEQENFSYLRTSPVQRVLAPNGNDKFLVVYTDNSTYQLEFLEGSADV